MNFVLVTRSFHGDYKTEAVFDSFRDAEQYASIWKRYQALKGTLTDYETAFITDELSYRKYQEDFTEIDKAAYYPIW